MKRIKQGFKGQRLIAISSEVLLIVGLNPLTENLYVTKIGFFPAVKYHYNNKEKGVDYYILIYCTVGEGWYKIKEKTYTVKENQYFILPPDTPYSFGANTTNPWTIYWIQFKGKMASSFFKSPIIPYQIVSAENSRFQDRIQLFEEIYENLELSIHNDHYCYASLCLFHFLASFIFIDQFRQIRNSDSKEYRFSDKVIHYMRENVENNLTLELLAKQFGYSTSHFSARFQRETNQSPIKYFIALKIEKACQYLELSSMKICDIYPKLGFQDAAYFSRIFFKIMSVSPSHYRQRKRQ